MTWDVAVIGGGPAGLSAALVLARSCRRVIVLDSGEYRNAAASAVHGYLGSDGIDPRKLRARGRTELSSYGVPITGVEDILPPIPGLRQLYGRSIFHCPYCDGWEVRGQPLAVVGQGGAEFAGMLETWSRDVMWFSEKEVVRFSGDDREVLIEQADGSVTWRRAVFLKLAGQRQRSHIAEMFGLRLDDDGVEHGPNGKTKFRGVYVAGDMTKDLRLSIVAAAEGAQAAVAVDAELREDDES